MSTNLRSGSTIDCYKTFCSLKSWDSFITAVCRHRLLLACIAVILSVSTLDTGLVYLLKDVIVEFERNPICLALIQRDPHDLTWFVCGKLIGNLMVVTALMFLFHFEYRNRNLVALAVAGFQIALTFYICLADPISGFLNFDGLFSNSLILFRRSLESLMMHLAVIAAAIAMFLRIRKLRLV